jgi:hypothetical protein
MQRELFRKQFSNSVSRFVCPLRAHLQSDPILRGGLIELEQMDSADTSLAIRGFYDCRDHQYDRHRTKEVHELDGLAGGRPARLAVSHRSVLVCTAVRYQVACNTIRLKRRPLTCIWQLSG